MNSSSLLFWLLSHPLPKRGDEIPSELFPNRELYFSAFHKVKLFLVTLAGRLRRTLAHFSISHLAKCLPPPWSFGWRRVLLPDGHFLTIPHHCPEASLADGGWERLCFRG